MLDHWKRKAPTKSKQYTEYQQEIYDELMGTTWPFGQEFVQVVVHFGISNRGKDLDNLNKPLLDTLQKVYDEFNDNKVYALSCFKYKVPKGEEYIDITIAGINEDPDS